MTMFRVGQQVVCVDAGPSLPGLPWEAPVVERHVYIVRETGLTHRHDPRGLPCIKVEGVIRKPVDEPMWMHRFRPVATTDISWAHKLVADLPKSKTLIDS